MNKYKYNILSCLFDRDIKTAKRTAGKSQHAFACVFMCASASTSKAMSDYTQYHSKHRLFKNLNFHSRYIFFLHCIIIYVREILKYFCIILYIPVGDVYCYCHIVLV